MLKLILKFIFIIILIPFLGCSKLNIHSPSEEIQKDLKVETTQLSPVEVETTINTPSEPFTISLVGMGEFSKKVGAVTLSTEPVEIKTEVYTEKGQIVINDPKTLTFTFIPNPGYRGNDDSGRLFLISEGITPGEVVVLANVLEFEKFNQSISLATRSLGCISCHAQIMGSGAIVSDFGLGLSESNSAIYLGLHNGQGTHSQFPHYGALGNHLNSFKSMKIFNGVKMVVPQLALPPEISPPTGCAANCGLKDYLSVIMKKSESKPIEFIIEEKSKIKIGAPTKEHLTQLWETSMQLPTLKDNNRIDGVSNALYFPEDPTNQAKATGLLQHANGVVYLNPDEALYCEGDILIKAPLILNEIQLNSSLGCRIYSISTIFLDGSLNYLSASSPKTNLQLSSATAIIVGVGNIKTPSGASSSCSSLTSENFNYQYCENTNVLKARFQYFTQPNALSAGANSASSCKVTPLALSATKEAQSQIANWSPNPQFFKTSSRSDTSQHILEILRDSDLADAVNGVRIDASCRSLYGATSSINYKSLLLNAPYIQGRYKGLFSGMIISENIMWSMGQFQIINDLVFTKVRILPLLDKTQIIDIQE